ncbi:MAG: tetratricopeptide repeat protein, partial [Chloroflexi bacterium]|nr:tetratricopeptide repeat protein [Chloroflexota bacterium]
MRGKDWLFLALDILGVVLGFLSVVLGFLSLLPDVKEALFASLPQMAQSLQGYPTWSFLLIGALFIAPSVLVPWRQKQKAKERRRREEEAQKQEGEREAERQRKEAERLRKEAEEAQRQRQEAAFKNYFTVVPAHQVDAWEHLGLAEFQETYLERESDIKVVQCLEKNTGVFILGKPNAGKTRMVYQHIKAMNGWLLLKPFHNHRNPELDWEYLRGKKVILLLDDLWQYPPLAAFDPQGLTYNIQQRASKMSLLVTCRDDPESAKARASFSSFIGGLEKVALEPIDVEAGQELARNVGQAWENVEFDGTPGSVLLGLEKMRQRYHDLKTEEKVPLQVLAILYGAGIYVNPSERVRAVAGGLFGLEVPDYQWDQLTSTLESQGFLWSVNLVGKRFLFPADDTYLERVVKLPQPAEGYFPRLREVLAESKDVEGLFYLGNTHYLAKNQSAAETCYQAALEIDPRHALAHNNYAILLQDLGRREEAATHYQAALEIDPRHALAHNNYAILLQDLGRREEAATHYQAALDIDPRD